MLGFGIYALASQCALVLSTFNQTLLTDSSEHSLAHAAGYGLLGKFVPETELFHVSTQRDGPGDPSYEEDTALHCAGPEAKKLAFCVTWRI